VKFTVTILITILLLLLAGTVEATSTQSRDSVTWYFTDRNATEYGYLSEHSKFMSQSAPAGSYCTITLQEGESVWWFADGAAGTDMVFPHGDWKVVYWVKTNHKDKHKPDKYEDERKLKYAVYVRLYVLKEDGRTELIKEKKNTLGHASGVTKKKCSLRTDPIILEKGDRLAVEIQSDEGVVTLYYNSESYPSRVTSPPHSPPYPVPELSTTILLCAGLVLLSRYYF